MLRIRQKVTILLSILALFSVTGGVYAQGGDIPRTADGRPDFNGIWQAMGSAHYDIEPHAADFGPMFELGAIGAIPGGLGIVEGGEIPYTAAARQKQMENKASWLELDPVVKCYICLLYTSPSPRDQRGSRMPSSA